MKSQLGKNEHESVSPFGSRLRELRHAKNMTQESLAIVCGLQSGEQISRYELGKEYPRLSTLAWMAIALEVTDLGAMLSGINPEDCI